jgi:putative tricarboxylic transport membrane protein
VSLKLGLGTLHKPGSGFISFWSGIILGILTLIMLIQDIWFNKANRAEEKKEKTHRKAVILTLAALFISILIFEYLGFIISTILFVGFLFKGIEKKGWFVTILASLVMTLASYYIFKVWLQAELPKGILGF